jgi:hypothetical protein
MIDENLLFGLQQYINWNNGIICGGCFKNILTNTPYKDIDIFFRNETDYTFAIEQACKSSDYVYLYELQKGKAYLHIPTMMRVEFCANYFGSPQELIDSFDFTVCKYAYYEDKDGNYKSKVHPAFKDHVFYKVVEIDNSIPNPSNALLRMIKYAQYGYHPTKNAIVKTLKELNKLDPEKINYNLHMMY